MGLVSPGSTENSYMNKTNQFSGNLLLLKSLLVLTLVITFYSSGAQSLKCQWARASGTIGNGEFGSVATDQQGNVYISGIFYDSVLIFGSDTLLNSAVGTADIYVVKYNFYGGIVWAKRLGGEENDDINGIATDNAGNLYLTGYYESPYFAAGHDTLRSPGNTFVLKYDASGNEIWARTSVGSSMSTSIAIDIKGNVCIAGDFWNTFTAFGNDTLREVNYRGYNIFVVKYNAAGSLLWLKGGNQTLDGDASLYDIKTDATGNFYVSGCLSTQLVFGADTLIPYIFSEYSLFLIKLDSSGNSQWAKCIGSFGYPPYQSSTIDAAGNVFLIGDFTYYPINIGTDTIQAKQYDIFIIKYNSNGNLVWAKTAGNGDTAEAMVYGSCTDPQGNIYISGYFSKPLLIIGGDTLYNPDTAQVISLLKLDNNGNAQWLKGAGQHGYNIGSSVASDVLGNIYMTGSFSDTAIYFDSVRFIPGSTNVSGVYLARYGYANESVPGSETNEQTLKIYPNPVSEGNAITATFKQGQYDHISIFNSLGQFAAKAEIGINDTKVEIALQSLPGGMYYLKATGKDNNVALPVIIRH